MTINPLYKTNNSPSNNTKPTKAVNNQVPHIKRSHNTFDMSYHNFKTHKFGQYEPFFVMEAVEGDFIPLKSNHSIASLPFASKFMSEIKFNKDFFMIPYNSIMPNTWEYIYKHPSNGEDVPANANCILPYQFLSLPLSRYIGLFDFDTFSINEFLHLLFCCEKLYSQGSLLNSLGYKIYPSITAYDTVMDFDTYFDKIIVDVFKYLSSLEGAYLEVDTGVEFIDNIILSDIDIYQFISLFRRFGTHIYYYVPGSLGNVSSDEFTPISDFAFLGIPEDYSYEYGSVDGINISRLLAYQLACSQYYVNPQVDYIYNAQLYRDNFYPIICHGGSLDFLSFYYNGVRIPYDFFSYAYFDSWLKEYFRTGSDLSYLSLVEIIDYLFSHMETLRFGDYFTDSRTQPLAIGDDTVTVSPDNSISVIDINKSLIYQRFRNAVVKMKNSYDNYINSMFGTEPAPDYHIPKHIVHYEDIVKSFEVANTSDTSTGNLVTNLSSSDSSKVVEITVDMSAIIIGISSFTIPRVYCQTKDRQYFHLDRFDMFNPMLQYLGDQPIKSFELSERFTSDTFAYQTRNSEYKQRYSVASGGFVTKLPSWSFITDLPFGPLKEFHIAENLNPSYIRSYDYEFNRFFKALSGYSLANSFHFITVFNNECVCNRPMEVSPNTI